MKIQMMKSKLKTIIKKFIKEKITIKNIFLFIGFLISIIFLSWELYLLYKFRRYIYIVIIVLAYYIDQWYLCCMIPSLIIYGMWLIYVVYLYSQKEKAQSWWLFLYFISQSHIIMLIYIYIKY